MYLLVYIKQLIDYGLDSYQRGLTESASTRYYRNLRSVAKAKIVFVGNRGVSAVEKPVLEFVLNSSKSCDRL